MIGMKKKKQAKMLKREDIVAATKLINEMLVLQSQLDQFMQADHFDICFKVPTIQAPQVIECSKIDADAQASMTLAQEVLHFFASKIGRIKTDLRDLGVEP